MDLGGSCQCIFLIVNDEVKHEVLENECAQKIIEKH